MGTHRIDRDGRIVTRASVDARRAQIHRFRNSHAYQRLRAAAVAAHPYCATPGCTRPITRANPLTLDHIEALARGGHPTDPSNLDVLCLSCNARKREG